MISSARLAPFIFAVPLEPPKEGGEGEDAADGKGKPKEPDKAAPPKRNKPATLEEILRGVKSGKFYHPSNP